MTKKRCVYKKNIDVPAGLVTGSMEDHEAYWWLADRAGFLFARLHRYAETHDRHVESWNMHYKAPTPFHSEAHLGIIGVLSPLEGDPEDYSSED